MTPQQHEIMRTMGEIDDGDPDISTPRLLEMTRHRCRVSLDDVLEAVDAASEAGLYGVEKVN